MKINNVSIKNFRGLQNFSIALPDRTVLVGGNNTSKTSILEAINLVLNPNFYYGPGLLSEYDFFEKQYENPDNQIRIEITLGDLNTDELHYFGDYVEPCDEAGNVIEAAPSTEVFDTSRKILRLHFSSKYEDEEIQCGVYYSRFGEDITVPKRDRRKIGFLYLGLQRNSGNVFSLSRNSIVQRIMREKDIDIRQQQRAILNSFPEIANILLENTNFAELLETLEKRFEDFVFLADKKPDSSRLKYELSDLTFSEINRGIEMFIHLENSISSLPLICQGNGIQNALTLALLTYQDGLQKAILAIDEPELCLHPHAQRYIMEQLIKSNLQVLVATHSPAIAETFELSDIRVLQHSDRQLRVFSFAHEAMAKAPSDTALIIKRRFADALFSKAIFLVEGATEEGAILSFNNALRNINEGLDLNRQELYLFNFEGIKFIGDWLKKLHPLPILKILLVDNDQDETFYESLESKVDLCFRLPKTPAGNDFEGMIAWQSTLEMLQKIVEQQGIYLTNRDIGRIRSTLYRWKNESYGDLALIEQLMDLPKDDTFWKRAITILIEKELNEPVQKDFVREIIAEMFRQFKGGYAASEWASLYTATELTQAVLEIFRKTRLFLQGQLDGKTHILN